MPDMRLRQSVAYRIALCERMVQAHGDLELEMRVSGSADGRPH